MNIKKSLANFYNMEAEKYYHTRNKHRADADVFLNEIKNSNKKSITILEFGCGSGRLLAHLTQLKDIKIKYIWVDISQELLKFAKKQLEKKPVPTNIVATFICDDIVHYIQWPKQESFDFVFWVASFQHIPSSKERFFLIKNIYRILAYDGTIIMTNRSFSLRFIKKYTKFLLVWLWKYIYSFGTYERNSLMIPWTNHAITSQRFYHIYTLAELKAILTMSGFIIQKLWYLNKWTNTNSWKHSQNSLIIAKKNIFEHEESFF